MKITRSIRRYLTALFLPLPMLMGCSSASQNTVPFHPGYETYYSRSASENPLGVYAWQIDDEWYTGIYALTMSTLPRSSMVQILQDEMPCPLEIMKDILQLNRAASEMYRGYWSRPSLFIVSTPPTDEECIGQANTPEEMPYTYIYLFMALGIPIYADDELWSYVF